MLRRFLFIALLGIVAACQQAPVQDAQLPTLASLPTLTATRTLMPSPVPPPTLTPTLTATASPSLTPHQGALFALAQVAARATVLPPTFQPGVPAQAQVVQPPAVTAAPVVPPPSCAQVAAGGFGSLFNTNPALAAQIGCPTATATTLDSALQNFERGTMIWLNGPIYVLYADGRAQQYPDTFTAGVDPESGGETPRSGLFEPVRGFGKVWRSTAEVRSGLGWATILEEGGSAVVQRLERGWMIDMTQRTDILVLLDSNGTWQSYMGNF